jgi:predicted GIY-YIG superfamily endonuclease
LCSDHESQARTHEAVVQRHRKTQKAAASADSWFAYILRCADGTLYTGIAKDVNRRCEQHNAGIASRYTRSRLPVTVVYQETQATRSLALKREAAIKAMSRQEKESLIRLAG